MDVIAPGSFNKRVGLAHQDPTRIQTNCAKSWKTRVHLVISPTLLVKVTLWGVNPVDWKTRSGAGQRLGMTWPMHFPPTI